MDGMAKMLCSMLGLTPEQLQATVEAVTNGVAGVSSSLKRIEENQRLIMEALELKNGWTTGSDCNGGNAIGITDGTTGTTGAGSDCGNA